MSNVRGRNPSTDFGHWTLNIPTHFAGVVDAVRAAKQAIERAGLQPSDIDLILCATVTPDQILPSTGCIIQAELGANRAAAMDLVAACSGFLYGLTIADTMIRTGKVRHAVVVGAEILTQCVD